MPIRRPPQPTESTALIERPSFSDDDGDVDQDDDGFTNVASRDVDSEERGSEQTEPERRLARKVADDAPTGRYDLNSLADFDDLQLPSTHVSEFDVSDLDGDVEGPGASTAIMQSPPSMIAQRYDDGPAHVDEVALRKWSAGPQGPKVTPLSIDYLAAHDDRGEMAATLPALSLAAVRAAAGVNAWPEPHLADDAPSLHLPLPPPPPPPALARPHSSPPVHAPPPRMALTATATAAKTRVSMLRLALDDALAAVTAAQACADAGHMPPGLHSHLDRAVELLSRAVDLAEGD